MSGQVSRPTQTWASLVAQTVKNLSAMQETLVGSLGREDPLEKGMATHSSICAWRIPWTTHGLAKNWIRLSNVHVHILTSLVAQTVKNLSAMQETGI